MSTQILDALRRGDDAAALALARQAVAEQAEDAGVQHALALCLQRAGDTSAAIAAATQAVALAPTTAHFRTTLAALAVSTGALEQGREAASAAVGVDPNHLPGYTAMVHLALARADLAEAERCLKMAQRVNPEHSRTLVAQAQVQQFRGEADAALKSLTQAVQADPDNAMALAMLGLDYLTRGQDAFAEQALRKARSLLPGDKSLFWSLLESLRRQRRNEELLDELNACLAQTADDARALAWRARELGQAGQIDLMLADLESLVPGKLHDDATISWLAQLLADTAPPALCSDWFDRKLEIAPDSSPLWRARLAFTAPDELHAQLQRWEASAPDSAERLSYLAVMAESQGQFEQAEQLADAGLALSELLFDAQMVKLRAQIRRREPQLSERLGKLDSLFAGYPQARATLAGWRPLALDALGRFDEAVPAMLASPQRQQAPVPLPRPQSAAGTVAATGAGVLLWGAPGSRVERLVDALDHGLETPAGAAPRLLQDRVMGAGRGDGHDALRRVDGHPCSNAERQQAISNMGFPADAIDWLPHWDAATAASLRGAQLWAVLRDPRDQLLNWLAGGTRSGYQFPSPEAASEWLARVMEMLADAIGQGDDVVVLRTDALDVDGAPLAARLGELLSLAGPLPMAVAGPARRMIGGLAPDFPEGHWRNYRSSVLGAAFARLTPVAVRLGYSAD